MINDTTETERDIERERISDILGSSNSKYISPFPAGLRDWHSIQAVSERSFLRLNAKCEARGERNKTKTRAKEHRGITCGRLQSVEERDAVSFHSQCRTRQPADTSGFCCCCGQTVNNR